MNANFVLLVAIALALPALEATPTINYLNRTLTLVNV